MAEKSGFFLILPGTSPGMQEKCVAVVRPRSSEYAHARKSATSYYIAKGQTPFTAAGQLGHSPKSSQ
jgi:hypothetical protein